MEDILLKKLNDWAGTKNINYTDPELGIAHCFKWLVPKFNNDVLLSHAPNLSDWHCDILGKQVYIGEEKTPALALCKAILRLIDSEGKDD